MIAKSGKPIAKLVPATVAPSEAGCLKGRIQMADDFDPPLPEDIAADFCGDRE